MRTTFDIDDDLLAAIRELSRDRRVSMGRVLSDLARQALLEEGTAMSTTPDGVVEFPLQRGAGVVTLEIVNRLRDESP